MPYRPTNSIEVRLWDKQVGAIAFDLGAGAYAFEYFDSFRGQRIEPAPLTLPVAQRGAVSFPHLPKETFFGLPSFIADSLPDSFGNALIDRWMAVSGVRPEEITSLDRLAYLGKRGLGALEFRPALRTGDGKPSGLEMGDLIETARRALRVEWGEVHDPVWAQGGGEGRAVDEGQAARAGQGGGEGRAVGAGRGALVDEAMPDDESLSQLIAVGTSAGGARAKAVVGYNEQTDTFLSGQFGLPSGYSHWIIKFDIEAADKPGRSRNYGRIEYAYALMAQACGIEMTRCRLYEAAGRAHFMTERFDRAAKNGKLHMQTLCGMAQLDFRQRDTHDYNQLFMTVDSLGLGLAAADEVFLRMIFNVCMANNDDHTKNHAFLMSPEGHWSLAPAYDITHAYRKDSLWVSRHLMSVNGRFEGIGREDVLAVAHRFNVASPKRKLRDVLAVARRWREFAVKAGVCEEEALRIMADIEECVRALS